MTTESTNQDNTAVQQQNPAPPTSTDTVSSGSPKREYSQAELDDLFRDRAKRAETSTLNRVLKLLGVNSEDELPTLKTTIDKAREIEQANLSASEKAEKAAADALKRATELEQQLNTERAERRNDKIASALTRAASAMKANDAEDVLLYAKAKHGEALNALIDDSGAVNEKSLTALMDKIKAEKGHYFTPAISVPGSRSNADGRHIPSEMEAMKRFSLNNQRTIRGG